MSDLRSYFKYHERGGKFHLEEYAGDCFIQHGSFKTWSDAEAEIDRIIEERLKVINPPHPGNGGFYV